MWPFKRHSQKKPPLLRLLLGDDEVFSVSAAELPIEKLPVVEFVARDQPLRFVDSSGNARSFDVASAFDEGARYFHVSARIHASYAVQTDGILTQRKEENSQEVFKAGGKALRLQPFMLPEFSGDTDNLIGRGLFHRGLHFSGMITPGNVSLMSLCDYCKHSFRLQSFHAGFSNLSYFYCSRGPHTMVASSHETDAPPVLGKADPAATARFEQRLPPCGDCGGSFNYANSFLCPGCQKPYIDFARHPQDRESENYGNHLYGASLQRFGEPL